MTPEAMAARLKELGIGTDTWQETPAGRRSSPLLDKQREALIQVRDLLQLQLEADRTQMMELHETLNRLRHGGGS
jgi:hypothetical protein